MILPSLLPFLPPTLQTFIAHFVVFSIPFAFLLNFTSSALPHLALFLPPLPPCKSVCSFFSCTSVLCIPSFDFVFILYVFIFRFKIKLFQRFVHLFLNFTSARSRFLSHSVILTTSFHNWPQALPHFCCSVGIAKPPFHKYAIKGTLWSFATLELTSFLQMGFCCVCILKRKRYVYLCYSHPATALTQF